MQGIFAEAYQMSLGRTGTDKKTGQEAIAELVKAMEKGNVISSKILPFVAEIANREAAPGLNAARQSSIAEENRFWTELKKAGGMFSESGGERGFRVFWQMMQDIALSLQNMAPTLGKIFQDSMDWLDILVTGFRELWSFFSSGEKTSIVGWLEQAGIPIMALREQILDFVRVFKESLGGEGEDSIFAIFARAAQRFLTGIVQNDVIPKLTETMRTFFEFLRSSLAALSEWTNAPWYQKINPVFAINTLDKYKTQGKFLDFLGSGIGATDAAMNSMLGGVNIGPGIKSYQTNTSPYLDASGGVMTPSYGFVGNPQGAIAAIAAQQQAARLDSTVSVMFNANVEIKTDDPTVAAAKMKDEMSRLAEQTAQTVFTANLQRSLVGAPNIGR